MTDAPAASRSWPRRLALLLLIAGIAGGGFALYHPLDEQLGQLRRDVQRLETRHADAERGLLSDQASISVMQRRVETLETQTKELRDALDLDRLGAQASAAEGLLVAADERLRLVRDVPAALRAYELADRRLAAARDPRLLPVRQALAVERAALMALPAVDREGIALRLAALSRQSPHWPVTAGTALKVEPAASVAAPTADVGWPQRVGRAVKQALTGMVSLRRDERGLSRALGAEQETLLRQLLTLRIEGARLALLAGDAASLRDLCRSAAAMLAQDFRADDAGVLAAHAELERLARQELDPPLPETGRALTLLREFLDRR